MSNQLSANALSYVAENMLPKVFFAVIGIIFIGFGFNGQSIWHFPPYVFISAGLFIEVMIIFAISTHIQKVHDETIEARDEIDQLVSEVRDVAEEVEEAKYEIRDTREKTFSASKKAKESLDRAEDASKEAQNAKQDVEQINRAFDRARRR